MPRLRTRLLALSLASTGCPDAPSYDQFPGLPPDSTGPDTDTTPTTGDADPTSPPMATTTEDDGDTDAEPDTTTVGETHEPPDQPPTVLLMLDPEAIKKAGPVLLDIEVSDDVVGVDVFYKDAVVEASVPPSAFPFEFAVTSKLQCDDEQTLEVIAHDGEGLSASATATLTCDLPAAGSEVARRELPGTTASVINAVAVLDDGFVAVGALDDRMVVWRLGPDLTVLRGWPRTLGAWSEIAGIGALPSSATAVTLDPDGNIIVAGNFKKNGTTISYVGRLDPEGTLIAEAPGLPHEEVAGVVVAVDGTIVTAGRIKTSNLPAFDWVVWGHKELGGEPWSNVLPLGLDEAPDPPNDRSERAWALGALPDGDVVAVGEREYLKIGVPDPHTRASWQRYDTDGHRVGSLWTSTGGDEMEDAANAVVVLPDASFVLTGWRRAEPGQAAEVISWRLVSALLEESRTEAGVTAEGKGIARDREGKLVVAATLTQAGQLDALAFAFGLGDPGSPRLWTQTPLGEPTVEDGYNAVACTTWGYCLTGGLVTKGAEKVGFLRLHHP